MPAPEPTPPACSTARAVARNRPGRGALALLAAAFVTLPFAPAASAAPARYEGSSSDGGVVFFATTDKLVPGDTDTRRDLYERSRDEAVGNEYVTREVSFGPTGGNQPYDAQYVGASGDGTRAFFTTEESLVPADTDKARDVYMRNLAANTTTLVSQGDPSCAPCGNGEVDASFAIGGLAAGGERVFFTTKEQLAPQDTDGSVDIYLRNLEANPATTTLVSQGDPSCAPCGNGADPALFWKASTDGTKAFLTTDEGLVAGDADGASDIYMRNLEANTTTLVSAAGTCPEGANCNPIFGGVSSDGAHVVFETKDRLSVLDTDNSQDVYDWSGGTPVLVSTGTEGEEGNGAHDALFADIAPGGSEVFFETDERLVSADEDTTKDVYVRSGGTTTLVSQGGASCAPGCGNEGSPAVFKWVSPESPGTAVAFTSAEALTAEDTDTSQDVYMRDLAASTTTLVSRGDPSCAESNCGNGSYPAFFEQASDDGSHIFFVTAEPLIAPDPEEPLLPADTDERTDVYDRNGGKTTLVSQGDGPCVPGCGNGPFNASLHGVSRDGARAFIVTDERLTPEDDFASEEDVYMRSPVATFLMSVGNDPELEIGPPAPQLEGTDPPSPAESTEPRILGQAAAGTEIKLYKNAGCAGEQALDPNGEPAGGSGEALAEAGIAVAVAAGTTTTFYATAEAEGIVSPCSNGISYAQQVAKEGEGGEEGGGGGEEGGGSTPPPSGGGTSGGGSTGTGTGGGGAPQFYGGGIPFVAPDTRISFGPSFKTRKRRAVFRFYDATGQPATRFICKLDRRRWHGCGSPVRLKKLRRGRHTFRVKAVNAAGMWEDGSTKRRFKVVGTARRR